MDAGARHSRRSQTAYSRMLNELHRPERRVPTDAANWTHARPHRMETFHRREGSPSIRELQDLHLLQTGYSRLTIKSWMKGFIGKLHEMKHGQWIFRIVTKHHHTNGTIQLSEHREVFKEINRQLSLDIGSLPPESRSLLEIPRKDLMQRSTGHAWKQAE